MCLRAIEFEMCANEADPLFMQTYFGLVTRHPMVSNERLPARGLWDCQLPGPLCCLCVIETPPIGRRDQRKIMLL